MNADWIEHKRGRDGELVGWIQPVGEDFVAFDLLGQPRTEPVDWSTAEEALESAGIGYLADPYEYLLDTGDWLRVRITEISSAGISIKKDDGGAIDSPQELYSLDLPAPTHQFRRLDG